MAFLGRVQQLRWSKLKPAEYSPVSDDGSDKNSEEGLLEKDGRRYSHEKPLPWWRNTSLLTAHFALFLVYVGILFLVARKSGNALSVGMPYCEFFPLFV